MPVRIFVIENDHSTTEEITNRLNRLGYNVVGVSETGDEGVQNIKVLKPDLIIMNTRLKKGTDGIKTGELIRSKHDVPIVFMTHHAGQATIRSSKTTGPFGYIFIPFTDRQIYTTIETALMRSQYEKKIRRQAVRAQTLVKSAEQLNSNLDFKTVLDTICKLTHHTLKASVTGVFLLNTKDAVYQRVATTSENKSLQQYSEANFEFPAYLVDSILSFQNKVVFISDVNELKEFPYQQLFRNEKIQSMVIGGIYYQQNPLGILASLFIEESEPIQSADFELLKGLVDQAAVAITNAHLFKQVQGGRENERKLAKNIVEIQEKERRHLARELHDHLGQILTGLQFMLENTKNQSGDQQRSSIEEIQKTISEVIEQVREMSLNLRPSILDDMGLLPTLQWHIERFETQTGIQVNFSCSKFEGRFPSDIETTAYRIIQEALTNVARHAQATEVFVGLLIQDDTLWIEILDQGNGFDTDAISKRSTSGLSGMRERASLVGGYLIIKSYPTQGTQIVSALPLTGKHLERRKLDRYNRLAGR